MVLRREAIEERLKELDQTLRELGKYATMPWDGFDRDLSQRWIIERGLLAAASVIFDAADHILAGHFGLYPETYEQSLKALRDNQVISEGLYGDGSRAWGGRNILIHRYLGVDPCEVFESFHKSLQTFPRFAQEIIMWLETLGQT